jgi:Uma2 family endonuclease
VIISTASWPSAAVLVPAETRRHDPKAGVPEVWLVDLERDEIVMYRQPEGGAYRWVMAMGRGETVVPEAIPELVFDVDDILAAHLQ